MQKLSLDIEVTDVIEVGSYIDIVLLHNESSQRVHIHQEVVKQRTAPGQVTLGHDVQSTITNFATSFNLDHSGILNAQPASSKSLQLDFVTEVVAVSDFTAYNPITGDSFANYTPIYIPVTSFTIQNIEFLPSLSNPCEKVRVKVTTNLNMLALCNNMQCVPVNATVGEIECFRGTNLTMICTHATLNITATQNINTPPLIESLTHPIQLNVVNTENGGSVTASFVPLVGAEFSLNGIDWQSSPSFSGLTLGNYTMYIRDMYGCNKQKYFSILENNFQKGIAFISKENSFRFREPFENYHTDENRSFCKSAAQLNYGYIQEFLNTDSITTQFRSNYVNIDIRVTDLDTEVAHQITPVQLTQNLNNKVKYNQVKSYQMSTNQFGLYFENGNILNYDTNIVIDSYQLNGALPIWAKLGNTINVNGIGYYLDNIGFDEEVGAEVLILNGTAPTGNIVVSSVFNIQDYEVYEFTVDFTQFSNRRLKIEIINDDPNFGEYIFTSEEINSVFSLDNYLEIRYWNSTNTNVIYSTNIRHLLRLPYNTIKANDSDTSENQTSDTHTHLLKSRVLEITDFEFLPFPLELYRKLKLALSLDNVFIDSVGYTKNAEFTKENLGSTNLYKLTASMVKNGFVFDSSVIYSQEITSITQITAPSLISIGNDGFIAQ